MKIVFVASNPSHQRPDSPAKRVLRQWVSQMGIADYEFFNVSNSVTPGNRPLKRSEFELDRLRDDLAAGNKFVALGTTASSALNLLGIQHHKLPHPSPRNRKLNDTAEIERLLKECSRFLEERC